MRISDWSSDVCSSDLRHAARLRLLAVAAHGAGQLQRPLLRRAAAEDALPAGAPARPAWRTAPRRPAVPLAPPLARALGKLPAGDARTRGAGDRKSVVWGKSVSVRIALGCRRIIKTKNSKQMK